jgi:serine/threonine-protein kinase
MKVCSECSGFFDANMEHCPKDGSETSKPLRPGDRLLGRYEFIECLGEGGMGVVYHARHDVFDRSVAIKILKSNEFAMEHLRRFELEARAISRLHHPNIIGVHEYGTSEFGYPYMVIDYVEGLTLSKLMEEEGFLSPTTAVEIVLQICSAVEHAHENSVVHRDLKPSNVMLKRKSNGEFDVKVLDFGIAKVIDTQPGLDHELTRTGAIFGSPLCMSPEQAQGKKVDHRTDIYSIGCILYEILTGAPPLIGQTVIETMVKQINEKPSSLHEASLGREFPPILEAVVFRALEKDPDKRFQTVKELAENLEDCLGQLPSFVDTPKPRRSFSFANLLRGLKQPEAMVLSLVAASCLLLVIAGYFFVVDPNNANGVGSRSKTLDNDFASIKAAIQPHDRKFTAAKIFQSPKDDQEDQQSFPEEIAGITPEVVIKSMLNFARGHDGEVALDRLAFTDKTLKLLATSAGVRSLTLKHCLVGNRFFDYITDLPIQTLSLEYVDITDEGMAKIHNLPFLMALELKKVGQQDHPRLSSAGLSSLNKLPHLRTLSINTEKLQDDDLKVLPNIRKLKSLNLSNNPKLSEKSTRSIEQLDDLLDLTMNLDLVPLSAIVEMKNFPHLRTLSLSESNCFTKEDLEKACVLGKNLEVLDLHKTLITNAELDSLRNMKKLRELNVQDCPRLDKKSIEHLAAALPDCLINSDQKLSGVSPMRN